MPTVHYMKKSFFTKHDLPLPKNPWHSHETSSKRKHNKRSPKNCKTSATDHQEEKPRWPPRLNQELTQRNNKEVHIIPSANIEYLRYQLSFSILFSYDQPGKPQQFPPQEHPIQQTNKHMHINLMNCVYNLPHRSRYSHQHKLDPTKVTWCTTTKNPSHSHEASAKRKHNQRSPKNCETLSSDHQQEQPQMPLYWE